MGKENAKKLNFNSFFIFIFNDFFKQSCSSNHENEHIHLNRPEGQICIAPGILVPDKHIQNNNKNNNKVTKVNKRKEGLMYKEK